MGASVKDCLAVPGFQPVVLCSSGCTMLYICITMYICNDMVFVWNGMVGGLGRYEHGRPWLLVSVQKGLLSHSWLDSSGSPHITFEENMVLCVCL